MRRRLVLSVALGFLLTACAAGPPPAPAEPPAPPPFDPTGTYDITVSAQGMEIGGVLIIQGSAESGYTGNIDTDMGGSVLTDVKVEGQTMTFSIPEGGMSAEVMFDGDEFTGWLAGGMGDADIIGVKR
jgi:hypothetical protein